ncbi:monofunctional biosynthetic peptidoglycan transglycosylase [candidate division KSB1 bacterium]|nr:monofunctional biosynthetic peptidoglycan transglycosylase [candidate division KSB1 bacterium]
MTEDDLSKYKYITVKGTSLFPPVRKRKRWGRGLSAFIGFVVLILLALIAFFYLTLPDVSALKNENPETTAMMEYREQQSRERGLTLRRLQYWRPLSRISPLLIHAVLISEDDKFFQHEGFDWDGMKQALEKNIDHKKIVRGGSTITQQLSKNLYLRPVRTPWRKIREAVISYRLESELDKRRILELYLNVIEWGNGIYGIEAAARAYYQKSASQLNASEAIRLSSILVNPHRYTPDNNRNRRMRTKRLLLAERMFKRKLFDEAVYQALLAEFNS